MTPVEGCRDSPLHWYMKSKESVMAYYRRFRHTA